MTGKRRIDRIGSDDYLSGINSKTLGDVRAMRAECVEEETVLSYERRLLHGRIAILRAELERRAGAGGSLIERLPEILADDGPRSTRGSYPLQDAPMLDFDRPKRRVEKLISDDTIANLESLDVAEVERIIGVLVETEREVSEHRRSVQRVLDAINADIARRYKTGEADPDDALTR